jgi:hypothetical protein
MLSEKGEESEYRIEAGKIGRRRDQHTQGRMG